MAAYGFVGLVPVVLLMAIPHGIGEAIQSPGTQAAVADAALQRDAAAAQGLAEAAGSHALRRASKEVRRITRALGPIRELDVALGHLHELGPFENGVAQGCGSPR